MTAGVECYRDGEATPYFSTFGGYILGSLDLSLAAGAGGSHVNANLSFGTPWYFALNTNNALEVLDVTFAGTTLNYSAPDGWHGTVFYGTFAE